MRLNNNGAALNTYTTLTQIGRKIDRSMKTLSSGYKINSVADDAAGLAISNQIKLQIKGLDAANRNSLDGISLTQTADGAFNVLVKMTQRIRELAVQASNGTLEPEDRQKIDVEVEQLVQELNSTAKRTEFNKIKLLNGDAGKLTESNNPLVAKVLYVSDDFAVSSTGLTGAGTSGLRYELESIGLPATFTLDITERLDKMMLPANADELVGQCFYINGEKLICEKGDTAETLVNKFTELIDRVGAKIKMSTDSTTGENSYVVFTEEEGSAIHLNITEAKSNDPVQSNGLLEWFGLASAVGEHKGTDAKLKNDYAAYEGVQYSYFAEGNKITFKGNRNDSIEVELQINEMDENGEITLKDGTLAYTGGAAEILDMTNIIKVTDYGQLKLQIGAFKNNEINIQIRCMDAKALGLEFAGTKSWEQSQKTIKLCDKALSIILDEQAKLGAYQNRLEKTIKSLDTTSAATQEALSKIYDADIAWEMTILTQNQVISQAAMSIMAQANNRPQMLLQAMG